MYRHLVMEAQYKPHEVDQINMNDFNKIFNGKKRKKNVRRAEAGALSPEEMMALI
ncbi:hypothetical protein [Staphylococcus felis]|uniref:hypothetical protein n=1 Tax=Staphylococcus felis TaxID=46127 RepID=UPI0015F29DEE|nr:hypothetical protein [Staphylococcus felis]